MRKAYVFQDIAQFSDFIRLYGEATASRGFTLYQVRDPHRPSQDLLLLLGFRKPRRLWSFASSLKFQEIQVDESDDALIWKHKKQDDIALYIVDKRQKTTLIELIDLKPWREEPQPLGRLVFWLRDPSIMPWLVTTSLRLGNDRIQYAQLKHAGKQALLLRIEEPSYYLIQWCEEHPTHTLDLYVPVTESLYVQWGFQHPLEDLWLRNQTNPERKWLFFQPEAKRQQVDPILWKDIYNTTEFSLDFPAASLWSQETEAAPRLQIPLRMEPRNHPNEPELWLLKEEHQNELEQLLSLIDEADLKTLLISVQEDPDGQRRFIVREKHLGEGRQFLDFGGQRFTSYKGFHNLFLPSDQELQPQLRRDQYRKLFTLKNGELTLVAPPHPDAWDGTLNKTVILKFRDNTFQPITHMIDYLIGAKSQELEAILNKSIFDFGHFSRSLRRPDLLNPSQERKPKTKQAKARSDQDDAYDEEALPALERKRKASKAKKPKDKGPKEEQASVKVEFEPTELERQEAQLERDLIQQGQRALTWEELTQVKSHLNKWSEATECTIEALWLTMAPAQARPLKDTLLSLMDQQLKLTGTPAKRLQQAQKLATKEEDPAPIIAYILHGQHEAPQRLQHWLQEASKLLRKVEGKLRKKTLWLLWGEILNKNGDTREQARLRETLLQELNTNGLAPGDIPHFIQSRLFQERWLQKTEDEEGTNEGSVAYANIDLIAQHIESIPIEHVRLISQGILARAFARIGYHAQARKLLEQALSTSKARVDEAKKSDEKLQAIAVQAWVALYSIYTVAVESNTESRQYRQQYQALIDQLRKHKNSQQLTVLQKIETSLEERTQFENPAEFLSKENFQRQYPSNPSSGDETISQMFADLKHTYQNNQLDKLLETIDRALDHIEHHLNKPKVRDLAWLLHITVQYIGRVRWGMQGQSVIQRFETFAQTLPETPPEPPDPQKKPKKIEHFYYALLRLNLAKGLMAFGNELLANQVILSTLEWTRDNNLVPLDFIDISAESLSTIEGAQLHHRRDPLGHLMQGILNQMSGEYTKMYTGMNFVEYIVSLLDQTVEAALSKEKLTLGLYKQYMDQDELLIRERILNETLNTPTQT